MVLNLIIDDESATIRTTFFGEAAEKIIGENAERLQKIKDTPDFERFLEKKSLELMGKDVVIRGRAKYSDFTSSYELSVEEFQDMNVKDELKKTIEEIGI